MGIRDDLMKEFGPILFEAMVIVMFNEVNRIRAELNLEPRTWTQFLAEIASHTETLEAYDWMEEQVT